MNLDRRHRNRSPNRRVRARGLQARILVGPVPDRAHLLPIEENLTQPGEAGPKVGRTFRSPTRGRTGITIYDPLVTIYFGCPLNTSDTPSR
jgi:hypothetical protein